MPKDLLIYGYINECKASEFFENLSEIEEGEQITLRINTNGGEIQYGHAMVNGVNELAEKGRIAKVLVDGAAASYGAWALLYINEVEALDVSSFMLHRPGYGAWYESSEYFTDADKTNLQNAIDHFEKALRAKLNVPEFERITKVKIADLISLDKRVDVYLTAKQALKCKLISSIRKISQKIKAEVEANMASEKMTEAEISEFRLAASKFIDTEIQTEKPNKMTTITLESLKAENRQLYDQLIEMGIKSGVDAERARINALLEFSKYAPELVAKYIKEGTELSPAVTAELTSKQITAIALAATGKESAGELAGGSPPAAAATMSEYEKNVRALVEGQKK